VAHVESVEAARKRKELADELSAGPHIRETERNLRLADLATSTKERRRYRRDARGAAGRAARILESAAFPPTAKQCNIVGRALLVWTFFERSDPHAARRYFEDGMRLLADDLPHVRAQLLLGMAEVEVALGRLEEVRRWLFGAVGREQEVAYFRESRRDPVRRTLTEEGVHAHALFTDVLSRAATVAYHVGETEYIDPFYTQALQWAANQRDGDPALLALVERRWERLVWHDRFFRWL